MFSLARIAVLLVALTCVSAFRKISFGNDKTRCTSRGEPCAEDNQCCGGYFCLKMHSSATGLCTQTDDNTYLGMMDQPCSDDSDCPSIAGVCCKQVSRYRGGSERRCRRYKDQAKECMSHH